MAYKAKNRRLYAAAKLDRDQLHLLFWKMADQRGRTEIHVENLREVLGVRRQYLIQVMQEMTKHGRIRKVASHVNNVGVYEVADPGLWDRGDESTHVRVHDTAQWG